MKPELLSVLVGSACGAVGYLFREYQNRVRPYLNIVDIEGGLVKRTDERPDTPSDLRTKVDEAYYLKSLGTTPNVGTIHDAWDRADDIVRFWPIQRQQLNDVLSSNDKTALAKSLPKVFNYRSLDILIEALLAGDRIKFPPIPDTIENNVPIFSGKGDDEGIVWISFPQNTVSFGTIMHEEIMKSKAKPFLRILSSLDPKLIRPVIEQIREVGEKDHRISIEVEPKLKKLRNESSRWVLDVYFANLSNKPLMIHTKCKLNVCDSPKRLFHEDAYVVLIAKTQSGQISYRDTASPLVVKAGEDLRFAVITEKQQKDMPLGSSLREAFDRAQGTCSVHLSLSRVGLIGKQRVCTPRAKFAKQPTTT